MSKDILAKTACLLVLIGFGFFTISNTSRWFSFLAILLTGLAIPLLVLQLGKDKNDRTT